MSESAEPQTRSGSIANWLFQLDRILRVEATRPTDIEQAENQDPCAGDHSGRGRIDDDLRILRGSVRDCDWNRNRPTAAGFDADVCIDEQSAAVAYRLVLGVGARPSL